MRRAMTGGNTHRAQRTLMMKRGLKDERSSRGFSLLLKMNGANVLMVKTSASSGISTSSSFRSQLLWRRRSICCEFVSSFPVGKLAAPSSASPGVSAICDWSAELSAEGTNMLGGASQTVSKIRVKCNGT